MLFKTVKRLPFPIFWKTGDGGSKKPYCRKNPERSQYDILCFGHFYLKSRSGDYFFHKKGGKEIKASKIFKQVIPAKLMSRCPPSLFSFDFGAEGAGK